jgi:hypothetical protein
MVNGWKLGVGVYKTDDGVLVTATFGTDDDPLARNSSDPYGLPDRLVSPGCNSLANPRDPNNSSSFIISRCRGGRY